MNCTSTRMNIDLMSWLLKEDMTSASSASNMFFHSSTKLHTYKTVQSISLLAVTSEVYKLICRLFIAGRKLRTVSCSFSWLESIILLLRKMSVIIGTTATSIQTCGVHALLGRYLLPGKARGADAEIPKSH